MKEENQTPIKTLFIRAIYYLVNHFLKFRVYVLHRIILRKLLIRCDPVLKRYILDLKFSNSFMKFQVFHLQCSNVVLNFRVSLFEFRAYRRHRVGIIQSLRFSSGNFFQFFRAHHE